MTTTSSHAPAHRLRVGQIAVTVLDDGSFRAPPHYFVANAPPAELGEVMAAHGLEAAGIVLGVHPLLVETAGLRVLLDTGRGAFPPGGALLASLAAAGIAPEEIDVVLITHLHTDHFGGALDAEGKLVFPNARHLIGAAEHAFWSAGPSLDELKIPDEFKRVFRQSSLDGLRALGTNLEQIAPGDEIAPGVTVLDARGHTPGQLAV